MCALRLNYKCHAKCRQIVSEKIIKKPTLVRFASNHSGPKSINTRPLNHRLQGTVSTVLLSRNASTSHLHLFPAFHHPFFSTILSQQHRPTPKIDADEAGCRLRDDGITLESCGQWAVCRSECCLANKKAKKMKEGESSVHAVLRVRCAPAALPSPSSPNCIRRRRGVCFWLFAFNGMA